MTYKAPIADISYALRHVVGLNRVNTLAGYEEATDDMIEAILGEAAKLAEDVLAPLNWSGDQQGVKVKDGVVTTPDGWNEAFKQFADGGWTTIGGSAQYGGQGMPACVGTAVNELWDSANMAFALCSLLTSGAVEAIEHHGSQTLRDKYLAKMIDGSWTGTMNLTEPQAGTDLAALRTKAVKDGDSYRISGQKIFITYGEHEMAENIIHLVLARTPDAPAGVKGISLFVVPKFLVNDDGSLGERNDLRCVSTEHKLGIHGSPTCVMTYGDNDGAIGYLVGEENKGLSYMFTMMNLARHAVGRQGYAIAERAYQAAVAYSRDRVQGRPMLAGEKGSKTIINHPDVRRILMTMRSQTEAMRMLAMECAVNFDIAAASTDTESKQQNLLRAEFLNPLVKGWATEVGVEMTSLGVQIHGGMGFIEETGAAQHYRDSRITTIYEGTTAIQANDLIGRKLGRDGGATMNAWFDEVSESIAQAEDSLKTTADQLASALQQAKIASQWVLENNQNPGQVFAVSVPYLMMLGTLAGGWMHMKSANVANSTDCDDLSAEYLKARISTAKYYMSNLLPVVHSHAMTVIQGAQDNIDFDEAAF